LQGFVGASEQGGITVDTVHKDVLGADPGQTSKATVYKQQVQVSCKLRNTNLKRWPAGWVDMTIANLAPKLLDP
jgi:hypothetical protein